MNKNYLYVGIFVGVWFLLILGWAVSFLMQEEHLPAKAETETPHYVKDTSESKVISPEELKAMMHADESSEESSVEEGVAKNDEKKLNEEIQDSNVSSVNTGNQETSDKKNGELKAEEAVASEEKKTEEVAEPIFGKFDIRGHVVNLKTDKPIADAQISLYFNNGKFLRRVTSSKDGAFLLKGVPVEDVHFRVKSNGYVNGVFKNFSATELQSHALIKLDPGTIIKGMVKDKATGAHIVRANVQVFKANYVVNAGVLTDENGAFEFVGIPNGDLELNISKAGFSSSELQVKATGADIDSLVAELERASILTIEILTDGSFQEIPNIRAYINEGKEARYFERSVLGKHASKNIYVVHGLGKEVENIRIHADGYTFPPAQQVKLEPGKETNLVFHLTKGAVFSGIVKDESGQSVEGVRVDLYEVFGGGRGIGDDVLKGSPTTDKEGQFTVGGITEGNIEIIIESARFKKYKMREKFDAALTLPYEIVLVADSFFDVNLQGPDGEDVLVHQVRFTPISAEKVFDRTREIPVFLGSLKKGHFRMGGVQSGLYKVSVTANGYMALLTEIDVKEGQVEHSLEIEKGLSVTGVVSDKAGAMIPQANVLLITTENGSNIKHSSFTDVNGFYVAHGLKANVKYSAQVTAKNFISYADEVLVTDEKTEFNFELTQMKMYKGVVLDASTQQPVQNYEIKVLGFTQVGTTQSFVENFNTSNGQFSVPISQNEFGIQINAPGFATYIKKNIKIGDPAESHLLYPGGSIEITLKADDNLQTSKLISIAPKGSIEDPQIRQLRRTDSYGKVFFDHLKSGVYHVQVANVSGYANYDGEVEVRSEVDEKMTVDLMKGFTLKGRVIEEGMNRPLTSGRVYYKSDLYVVKPIVVPLDANGFFNFYRVPPGKHQLTLHYGLMKDGQFSKKYQFEVDVPDVVHNSKGEYVLEPLVLDPR